MAQNCTFLLQEWALASPLPILPASIETKNASFCSREKSTLGHLQLQQTTDKAKLPTTFAGKHMIVYTNCTGGCKKPIKQHYHCQTHQIRYKNRPYVVVHITVGRPTNFTSFENEISSFIEGRCLKIGTEIPFP